MRLLFGIIALLSIAACNKGVPKALQYIDADKPLNSKKLFAKDFISKADVSEYGSCFNEKGDEFFFGIDAGGKSEIWYTKLDNKKWATPYQIFSDATSSFNDPFLSYGEDKLFYISDLPRNGNDTISDFDIWYSKRMGNGWSEPINAGVNINSDRNEYYMSFTSKEAMYFSSNKNAAKNRDHDFDIYKSEFINDEYQIPVKLSDSINTGRYEADVFISPDESFIIFCSARRSGLGNGDLYISFRDENENWSKAISMGASINSSAHELCPFVTKDGKYFFYTSEQNIYWVSTDILRILKDSY